MYANIRLAADEKLPEINRESQFMSEFKTEGLKAT